MLLWCNEVKTSDGCCSYQWKKDGEDLEITGINIRQLPGVGTIQILNPTVEQHEGIYQCFARNEFGTAISIRTMLKKAGMSLIVILLLITAPKILNSLLLFECTPALMLFIIIKPT